MLLSDTTSNVQSAELYEQLHDAYLTILYAAVRAPEQYQPDYVLNVMRVLEVAKIKEFLLRGDPNDAFKTAERPPRAN